jgi:hypothetical protein
MCWTLFPAIHSRLVHPSKAEARTGQVSEKFSPRFAGDEGVPIVAPTVFCDEEAETKAKLAYKIGSGMRLCPQSQFGKLFLGELHRKYPNDLFLPVCSPRVVHTPSSTPTASENNGQLLPAGVLGTWPALMRRLFRWKQAEEHL